MFQFKMLAKVKPVHYFVFATGIQIVDLISHMKLFSVLVFLIDLSNQF